MRLPDSFVTELKARVRLSDVIGRKVKLRKQGRDWVGLSPFSNEKTPSFHVHDDKGFYKCFSTQKSGDAISFVMETERLSFAEAVEKLARDVGLEVPASSEAERVNARRRAGLYEWQEEAAAWYEQQLRAPSGAAARAYLEDRGFGPESWGRYRLGFAPKAWRGLADHLVRQGASEGELIEAGLLARSETDGGVYSPFRNRVMFPIEDASGRVIAFGARTLDPDGKPKYLNSGETPLFHKGRSLFRYRAAREALAKISETTQLGRGLVVAEGYIDVISLAEAGIGTAVAPLGTALTEEQLELVWRAGPEPILCFDGDDAGMRASFKAVDRALPLIAPGRTVYFAMLPTGLDPDDLLRKQGVDAMRRVLTEARPLVDVLWSRELAAEPVDTPERRAGLETRLMEAAGRIKNDSVRKAYLRELRDRLYWHFRTGKPNQARTPARAGRARPSDAPSVRGLWLLMRAIDSPAIFELAQEALCRSNFADPEVGAIRDAAFSVLEGAGALDRTAIADHLRFLGRKRAAELLGSIPTGEAVDPQSAQGRIFLAALEQFPVASMIAGESAVQVEEGDVGMMTAPHEARIKAYAADRQRVSRFSEGDTGVDPRTTADSTKLGEALRGLGDEMKRRSSN